MYIHSLFYGCTREKHLEKNVGLYAPEEEENKTKSFTVSETETCKIVARSVKK